MNYSKDSLGLLIVLFVAVGFSARTLAYVDAGTGSYLLQLFVAGILGLVFSLKSFWARVRVIVFGDSRTKRTASEVDQS